MFLKNAHSEPNLSSLSDEQLIRLFRQHRSPEHFAELFERYVHLVHGICLDLLEDPEESRDMVMQIFEKCLTNLPSANVQSFNKWLFSVARNECINTLRKNDRQSKWSTTYARIYQHDPKNEALSHLLKEPGPRELDCLEEALSQLKPPQRRCIELFYFEKKSYRQISEETNWSFKAVKSFLQNGRKRLKKILSELAGEP